MNKKLIITFGSERQSKELNKFLDNNLFKIAHVIEDAGNGYSKDSKELAAEVFELIKLHNLAVKAFISMGRATVVNGIPNIIESWRRIRKVDSQQLKNTIYIGPSYMAGKFIPDKWLATELFKLLELPITKTKLIHLNKTANLFGYPFIVKPTKFSGGAGMKYVTNISEFNESKKQLQQLGEKQAIVTEYIQGMEVSVELLRLGNRIFIYPPGTKQFTKTSLNHADNKVKIYGYIKSIPEIEKDAIELAEALNLQGLLSVEGIIHNNKLMRWKIMEAAPRVTGNLPMEDASIDGTAFKNIARYLQGKELKIISKHINTAIEVPVYVHNNEKTISDFLAQPWVKRAVLDDLGALPGGSHDKRKRIRVGFMGGNRNDLIQRCQILEKFSGDITISNRVIEAVRELNKFFGDYVIKSNLYELD